MNNRKIHVVSFLFAAILLVECEDIYDMEKYNRPDWLAGKLYTQVAAEDDLSGFAECLRLTGYDTILDVSGSFTVFAPSDEAMDQFLGTNQCRRN